MESSSHLRLIWTLTFFTRAITSVRSRELRFPPFSLGRLFDIGRQMDTTDKVRSATIALCIDASATSSLVISGHYGSHPMRIQWADNLSVLLTENHTRNASLVIRMLEDSISKPQRYVILPDIIRNPTPAQFLAACCVYGVAMGAFSHMRRHDEYQKHFFVGGVASALILTWASNTDLRGGFMDFMPWTVIILLVLSAGFHKTVGRHRERTLLQRSSEEKQKLPF